MDHAAAQLIQTRTALGKSTNVDDVEYFLQHMDKNMGESVKTTKFQSRQCKTIKMRWHMCELCLEKIEMHGLSGLVRTQRSTTSAFKLHSLRW